MGISLAGDEREAKGSSLEWWLDSASMVSDPHFEWQYPIPAGIEA